MAIASQTKSTTTESQSRLLQNVATISHDFILEQGISSYFLFTKTFSNCADRS
ncbi:MAG: hypothetical protein ACRC2R_13070 [Xenococcaceae cyanobacterium]